MYSSFYTRQWKINIMRPPNYFVFLRAWDILIETKKGITTHKFVDKLTQQLLESPSSFNDKHFLTLLNSCGVVPSVLRLPQFSRRQKAKNVSNGWKNLRKRLLRRLWKLPSSTFICSSSLLQIRNLKRTQLNETLVFTMLHKMVLTLETPEENR